MNSVKSIKVNSEWAIRILCGLCQPMQLYVKAGFSSPQASFFLIWNGDRAGVGYHRDIMPRSDSYVMQSFTFTKIENLATGKHKKYQNKFSKMRHIFGKILQIMVSLKNDHLFEEN